MKKAIASGVIGLIALGSGVAIAAPGALAQDAEELTREERRELIREHRSERRADTIETLTSVLGVTEEDLLAAKEAGQSIADVAAAQGVDVQTVVDALIADAQARIDAKVADGTVDADRAAEFSERLEERITARVNGERPERGDGEGFGRRGHGPRGFGGDAAGEGADA